MMEPTEDEIRAVAEVTGLDPVEDRSMVLNALQVRLYTPPSVRDNPADWPVEQQPQRRYRHQRVLR